MTANDKESSSLSNDPMRAARDVLKEWEQLCDRDADVELRDFVQERPGLSNAQIATLVHMEQNRYWTTPRRRSAEDYFQWFPDLVTDPEAALDVVYGEYLVRVTTEASEQVLNDLMTRFPGQAAMLRAQVSLHDAVGREGSATRGRRDASESPDDLAKTARATLDTQAFSRELHSSPQERTQLHEWLVRIVDTGELSDELETFAERYELRSYLGRGGMGVVLGAYDRKLSREVAIKMPRPDFASPTETSGRFEREARLAAQLSHPHLCPIFDVGRWRGITYLTMPYLMGKSLAERLAEGQRLSIDEAVEITTKVADGLHFAHERGIVHRDLKPANIMFNAAGEPIVMDFGLARYASSLDDSLTVSGIVQGTPLYMAPEQWDDAPLGHKPAADIYSLGVLLYELLVGVPPFEGTYRQVTRQAILGEVEPPAQRGENIDESLSQICLRAMALDPDRRWPTMADFSSALADWRRGARIAITNGDVVDDRRDSKRDDATRGNRVTVQRRWVLAAVVTALLLTLAGGWHFRPLWSPISQIEPLPVGSVWEGRFVFRPPYANYEGDVTIEVTRRSGDEWEGTYATENGQYQWLIAGTLNNNELGWRTIDVIHEPEPRPQMRGARAKGQLKGSVLRATIEIPGNGSTDVADITLTLRRETTVAR